MTDSRHTPDPDDALPQHFRQHRSGESRARGPPPLRVHPQRRPPGPTDDVRAGADGAHGRVPKAESA